MVDASASGSGTPEGELTQAQKALHVAELKVKMCVSGRYNRGKWKLGQSPKQADWLCWSNVCTHLE